MHINLVRSHLTFRKPFRTPQCRSRHLHPPQRHRNPQRSPCQLNCLSLLSKEGDRLELRLRSARRGTTVRNLRYRAIEPHELTLELLADPMPISAIRMRPQSGDQPAASLHVRLRQATAESHAMLDKLFGGFDLRDRAGYRRFLEASAAA